MRIFFSTQMFIVSTICLHSALAATDLYVMKSNRMWDYGKPPCKIATPDLNYTRDGPNVIIPPDVIISDDERVVVGHTRTFEVFQYIGCMDWYDLQADVVYHKIQADPGQCYSVCKTTYIGLMQGDCLCLSDRPEGIHDTYQQCSSSCVHPSNTACGGIYWFFLKGCSLYKHVETNSKIPDDGKYCRMYDSLTSTYMWQYCDRKLHGLCETNTTDEKYLRTKDMLPWNEFPIVCFRKGIYPATENITKKDLALLNDSWIGQIKSQTIVSISNAEPEDFKYGYYGYISKRNDTYFLEFTKETSDSVLCIKDDGTTSTSLSISTPARTATTLTTMSAPLFRTSVAVCVVVPLVVLLTGTGVVVLVVRRKRNHTKHKGNQKVHYSNQTKSEPAYQNDEAPCTDEFDPNTNDSRGNAKNIQEGHYENSAILGKPFGKPDDKTCGARASESGHEYEEPVEPVVCEHRADNMFALEQLTESSDKHDMKTQNNIDDTYCHLIKGEETDNVYTTLVKENTNTK